MCVRLSTRRGPIVLLNVYRPGSSRPQRAFFDELSSALEALVTFSCPVIVGGDFNIQTQTATNTDTLRLNEVLSSFDMTQHVTSPTHRCGGTLDLVMTFSSWHPHDLCVDPPGIISDHSLVRCRLPIFIDPAPPKARQVRAWRTVDRAILHRAIQESVLCQPVAAGADVDQLVDMYNSVLKNIADQLAPLHTVRRPLNRCAPWFDAECREARRICRRRERRYRKSGTSPARMHWIDSAHQRFQLYRKKKEAYWLNRLTRDGRSPVHLWRSLSSLLVRDRDLTGATEHTADGFADCFQRKVEAIRLRTEAASAPILSATATSSSLPSFRPVTCEEVRRIIMSSQAKSCFLDPIPTSVLLEFLDLLTPFITAIVNASLTRGRLPTSQKHAIVTPRLKKPGLDPSDTANFRPISNLSFLSKVIEKAVVSQLHDHLNEHSLLPQFQSAYRQLHSTETAMLRVTSDILTAADNRQVTLLCLLDLSAAFDCVDHDILLQRLQHQFGLSGDVYRWMSSFLTDRTQTISYNSATSAKKKISHGVPQGSVLGPLLFNLYTAELGAIAESYNLRMHQYADDCQLYVSVPTDEATSAAAQLSRCVTAIDEWLRASRLLLNPTKTQLIWLGSRQQVSKVDICNIDILSTAVSTVERVRDLGVVLDSHLTMSSHVAAVCRSAFCFLRQLRSITRTLPTDAAKTLVQAFVTSRLDYCNSILSGISDFLLRRLQAVQNTAARLITRTRRFDRITPVLRQLHWLPVRRRIEFKLAMQVYKALHHLSPPYLRDDLSPATNSRELRSSAAPPCRVPRTRSRLGDRAFAAAGPRLWNSLPPHLRNSDLSLLQFRRAMKTFLFDHH